jgi:plasmid stabilization system protein ParE
MEYRVEIQPRAERDLRQLYVAIDAVNSDRAYKWFNGLEKLIASLDLMPYRGMVVPEAPGLRQLLYSRRPNVYRLIYRVDDDRATVSVIHIRHGARDWLDDASSV